MKISEYKKNNDNKYIDDLILYHLGKSKTDLIYDIELTIEEINLLNSDLLKLEANMPIQYVIGHVDFYGNKIYVDENVLIPRFETEELIFNLIKYINTYFKEDINILDIGCGSGCISIALAKNIQNSKVTALDISKEALYKAKMNALENNVDIEFIESDVFSNVSNKYDCIISNPPYISHDEEVEKIVLDNEPNIALFASNKGLYFYDKILEEKDKFVNKKHIIAFEIGYKQKNDIELLIKKYCPNSKYIFMKDLSEKDRFVYIFNNCE